MRARLGGLGCSKGLGQWLEPSGVAEDVDVGHRVGGEANDRHAGVATGPVLAQGGADFRKVPDPPPLRASRF